MKDFPIAIRKVSFQVLLGGLLGMKAGCIQCAGLSRSRMASKSLAAFLSQPWTRSAFPFIKRRPLSEGGTDKRLGDVFPLSDFLGSEDNDINLDRQITQRAVVLPSARGTRKARSLHDQNVVVTAGLAELRARLPNKTTRSGSPAASTRLTISSVGTIVQTAIKSGGRSHRSILKAGACPS